MFESTEQRVCDQARAIKKRQEEDESQGGLCREDVTVEVETVETDFGTVKEEMNNVEDSIGDNEGDLSEEYRTVVN